MNILCAFFCSPLLCARSSCRGLVRSTEARTSQQRPPASRRRSAAARRPCRRRSPRRCQPSTPPTTSNNSNSRRNNATPTPQPTATDPTTHPRHPTTTLRRLPTTPSSTTPSRPSTTPALRWVHFFSIHYLANSMKIFLFVSNSNCKAPFYFEFWDLITWF